MYRGKKIVALIPAAGMGTRMGTEQKKQFLMLGEKEILNWTITHLLCCLWIDQVVVIAPKEDVDNLESKINKWTNESEFLIPISVIEGGETRQESVYNGLISIQKMEISPDFVLIHDGVRPFIPLEQMNLFFDILLDTSFKGVIAGTPVTDTLKKVDSTLKILETVDRSVTWAVQTPQVFEWTALNSAHKNALENKLNVTDDAALLELIGYESKIIECSSDNIKITKPFDLILAEFILNHYCTGK